MQVTEELLQVAISTYNECLEKFFPNTNHVFRKTPRNLKSITKTLESLSELSSGKVRDFVVYGFFCLGETRNLDKFSLSWIFGPKILNRYANASTQELFYLHDFKRKYNIQNTEEAPYKMGEEYKDSQRSMFYGTERGYLYCLSFGGHLFDIKNSLCKKCIYKSYCNER
jgi:hypothetical protein